MSTTSSIIIKEAKEHNLKSIDVEIPHDTLTVITGVSGSGKSSLAYDIIFKEGQKRYLETFSGFARQHQGKLTRANVGHISGLRPALAIDQKSVIKNPRSTVGTMSEIYDYLRLLFAKTGDKKCPDCKHVLSEQNENELLNIIFKKYIKQKIQFLAPVVDGHKGEYRKEMREISQSGFSTIRIDGTILSINPIPEIDKNQIHQIEIPFPEIEIKPDSQKKIKSLLQEALKCGKGVVKILSNKHLYRFSLSNSCPNCFSETPEFGPRIFSFNSNYGACPSCKGLGVEDMIAEDLLIEDSGKSIRDGALVITTPSGYIIYSQVTMDVMSQVCNHHGFTVDIPWQDLTQNQKKIVLYGSNEIKIPFGKHPLESRMKWSGITAKPREEGFYKGIIPVMDEILKRDRNPNILRFAKTVKCKACNGNRLRKEALSVDLNGKNIVELSDLSIDELKVFLERFSIIKNKTVTAKPIIESILKRILILQNLGLGYLSLNRESTTLSGGEAQRIRLATQAVSGLSGMIYVLDEPSIGLHQKDSRQLINLLKQLRDNGNTIIVVEHDEDIIRQADYLIDLGPGAGIKGGEILFAGYLNDFLKISEKNIQKSFTWKYLSEQKKLKKKPKNLAVEEITIQGAYKNNLKNINVSFKKKALNVVSGVSGAGKKSLLKGVLGENLHHKNLDSASKKTEVFEKFQRSPLNPLKGNHLTVSGLIPLGNKRACEGKEKKPVFIKTPNKVEHKYCSQISGISDIKKIIEIDQSPIGKTPRSNPATYTGMFDHIRDLFASLPASKAKKWKKGVFSFNVKGGRCEDCQGAGIKQIGMHFLGNVNVLCENCSGKRFNEETLEVKYKGKSIYDVLELSISDAQQFFADQVKIHRIVNSLIDLGLGYVKLGQASTTLSGGEAQRIKLASELSKATKNHTLYILDEPTTGLHFHDVEVLIKSLREIVNHGNTIICIEHNPDFLLSADWIVDLGPGSGKNGGNLVANETPENLINISSSDTGKMLRNYILPTQHLSTKKRDLIKKVDDSIQLKGITTHNLKNIDVSIPKNKLTVITGVSGSGKSSLAFDTLFAESQNRYMENLSTYSRRFMKSIRQASLRTASGLSPAIAINQKSISRNPRSTLGTTTEIYDYYRLLYSRIGKPKNKINKTFTAQNFSFNHHSGACEMCKGLGMQTVCDPEKIISNPDKSIISGAMNGTKTGKFYGDPFGQYVAALIAVGEKRGLDFNVPWNNLSSVNQDIVLFGSGREKFNIKWDFKRKDRTGRHEFHKSWPGIAFYINEEYERKHADNRGESMLPIMKQVKCDACNGARLKNNILNISFANLSISELSGLTVVESISFFEELKRNPNQNNITALDLTIIKDLTGEVLRRLNLLLDLGLGYLTIDRRSETLSGGEAQRVRLAGLLGSELTGATFVLDEPTVGLHTRDTRKMAEKLIRLRDVGNTVVVVEHDKDIIKLADHIIDMGPGAGKNGGEIVISGNLNKLLKSTKSITADYISGKKKLSISKPEYNPEQYILIKNAFANNLNGFDLAIPCSGLTVFTGVSGSGKSSLLFDVIAESAKIGKAIACSEIEGLDVFDEILLSDQSPIGTSPQSTPATYLGVFDQIRVLFANTLMSQERKYSRSHFSFNNKAGKCQTCNGLGHVKISMDFLADIWTECEECKGKRYNPEILEVIYQGKNINEVLNMTTIEARGFFNKNAVLFSTLDLLCEIGLDYLQLGQASNTLSGGEAQRLKLAKSLMNSSKQKNLYLIDEPTTGLHFCDIEKLLKVFRKLTSQGHTLLVIEHNLDVIQNADWIIDLGPEGGNEGGNVVFQGNPTDLLKCDKSLTGSMLIQFST